MNRPVIKKPATRPPERARAAEFLDLDQVFEALDAIAPKRAPTRAEWLATLAARSPREPDAAQSRDGA